MRLTAPRALKRYPDGAVCTAYAFPLPTRTEGFMPGRRAAVPVTVDRGRVFVDPLTAHTLTLVSDAGGPDFELTDDHELIARTRFTRRSFRPTPTDLYDVTGLGWRFSSFAASEFAPVATWDGMLVRRIRVRNQLG